MRKHLHWEVVAECCALGTRSGAERIMALKTNRPERTHSSWCQLLSGALAVIHVLAVSLEPLNTFCIENFTIVRYSGCSKISLFFTICILKLVVFYMMLIWLQQISVLNGKVYGSVQSKRDTHAKRKLEMDGKPEDKKQHSSAQPE